MHLFICMSHSPVSPQVPFLASSCRMKRSPHSCFFLGGGGEKQADDPSIFFPLLSWLFVTIQPTFPCETPCHEVSPPPQSCSAAALPQPTNPPGAGGPLALPRPHSTPRAEEGSGGSAGPAQPCQAVSPTVPKSPAHLAGLPEASMPGGGQGAFKGSLKYCPVPSPSLSGLSPLYEENLVRNTVWCNSCPWRAQGPGASLGFTAGIPE